MFGLSSMWCCRCDVNGEAWFILKSNWIFFLCINKNLLASRASHVKAEDTIFVVRKYSFFFCQCCIFIAKREMQSTIEVLKMC